MNHPSSIMIMGIKYKILYLPPPKIPGSHGEADLAEHVIKISDQLSETGIRSTLLHEIIHVVLYNTGMSELFGENTYLDEALTLALEHGLFPLVELKCLQKVRP